MSNSNTYWNGDLDAHLKPRDAEPQPLKRETRVELAQRLSKSLGLTCEVRPSENRLTHLIVTIPKEHDILTATIRPTDEATSIAHMMSIIEDVCCAIGIRPFYLDRLNGQRGTLRIRPNDSQNQYFMPHDEVTDEMHYTMLYEGATAKAVEMSTYTKGDEPEKACVSVLLCHHNSSVKYRLTLQFILTRYGQYAIEAGMMFIPIESYSSKIVDQRKDRYRIDVVIAQEKQP